MKAIVFDRFGGPEVLHESEVDVPEPGPGQVRLRVRAAGVNPIDGKLRQGLLEAMYPILLPAIPGVEAAGTMDAVGEGVTGLSPVSCWGFPYGLRWSSERSLSPCSSMST